MAKDRDALLKDAEYFARELADRLERLETKDSGNMRSHWQQAAKITRQVRGLCRRQTDYQRRQRRLARLDA